MIYSPFENTIENRFIKALFAEQILGFTKKNHVNIIQSFLKTRRSSFALPTEITYVCDTFETKFNKKPRYSSKNQRDTIQYPVLSYYPVLSNSRLLENVFWRILLNFFLILLMFRLFACLLSDTFVIIAGVFLDFDNLFPSYVIHIT